MKELRFTLITDGSSDRILLNIIRWLLNDLYPKLPNKGVYADYISVVNPPKRGEIAKQFISAEEYFPFDLLFYHRDAEKITKNIIEERKHEINSKLTNEQKKKVICVIPKIMMETWLLINEDAIKKAADNSRFNEKLSIPNINSLETKKDTKKILHDELNKIGSTNRRFNVHRAVHLVSEYIEDFSPLRKLEAFQIMENELKLKVDSFLQS